MKDAKPERYRVDRVGTPDPATSEYFVLDIVHDFEARVAVAKLGSNYERLGQHVRAREAHKALEDTAEAHRLACEARNPKQKASTSNKRVRS